MSTTLSNDPLSRMTMGGDSSSAKACKISMLWNWYTIDTCFIAKSWKNDTRGKFAGSCIGCFLLVLIAQWLNRVSRQFDIELAKRRKFKMLSKYNSSATNDEASGSSLSDSAAHALELLVSEPNWKTTLKALGATMSHTWYVSHKVSDEFAELEPLMRCCSTSMNVYPTVLDHVLRSGVFTLQWGLSYIIMLLFMYYNGYIIISCLLGALFGRLFFNFEPLTTCGGASSMNPVAHDKEENDRKCCM
ncbi:LANO_0G11716g1_1 [Lachancea nothofagi CBS 11611]|uniref:Copper transport protein n=1 Tax=Lachancea nothofagi CBS 11611 TaxID=1266666 RepID=A0A1G4KJN1_9SACH|nr:LANO_0G11716g1_1 [Lachancea nothofagi CBS 11611]